MFAESNTDRDAASAEFDCSSTMFAVLSVLFAVSKENAIKLTASAAVFVAVLASS